jgi:diguanylate cyclase (GGDEF)-like protein
VFDRRAPEPALALIGVAVWFAVCRLWPYPVGADVRALIGAGIVASYTWLTAFEFWRGRDEALVSRWPAIFMLSAHGALFMLRTPLGATLHVAAGNDLALSGWLELVSLEALLFTISIAFILLAMAKERTEYRHRAAARTDPLTGIANRRGFLEQAVSGRRLTADGRPIAVLLFDLDHFKLINDCHGHAVGDRVLQIFADVAKANIGASGLICRWGGDEFVALLYDTGHDHAAAAAEKIQAAFAAAVSAEGQAVNATVSTGMVFSANDSAELPALLLQADQALYRAKQSGRNRLVIAPADDAAGGEDLVPAARLRLHNRQDEAA